MGVWHRWDWRRGECGRERRIAVHRRIRFLEVILNKPVATRRLGLRTERSRTVPWPSILPKKALVFDLTEFFDACLGAITTDGE